MPATKFDKPVFPGAKLVSATVTVTNTSGSYSNTFTDERIATSMRAFQLEIEDPSVFNDKISITTADGSFTIACDSVAGETDVTIGFLKIADDPTAVTSSEFTILNNRIGNLASLETTDKTSMVNAVNEVVDAVSDNTQDIAGKINTSDIANNLTTTTAGKVLDARQGKALNDAINTIFPQVQTATSSKSVTFTITHQAGLIILRRPNTASSANVGLVVFVKQNSTINVQSISNAWSDTTVTGGTNNVTVSTTYSNGIIVHLMQFGEW